MTIPAPPLDAGRDSGDSGDDLIDGYTLDQLSDYLDDGMTPADPGIDNSPACQIALASLRSVRAATVAMIEAEAATEPEPDTAWFARMLGAISLNAHAGRRIPLPYPDPTVHLTSTEGAIRGLIRAAGDTTPGALVGRCTLNGDITTVGAPIHVHIDATVQWGSNISDTTSRLRNSILTALQDQTSLNITQIDITVHDVHLPHTPPTPEPGQP